MGYIHLVRCVDTVVSELLFLFSAAVAIPKSGLYTLDLRNVTGIGM